MGTVNPTPADIAKLCPRPSRSEAARHWQGYVDALVGTEGHALLLEFGVLSSPLRWCHFIATVAHESGNLTALWESGAYRADVIVRVFGQRHSAKVTPAEAQRLAGNAYALFERVYGIGNPTMARKLGNRAPGDGYRFRGLGPGQTTGRAAHERCARLIGCPLEELATYPNALHAMLLQWREKDCNTLADHDATHALRKRWNGGLNGLEDVDGKLGKAKRIWPARAAPPTEEPDTLRLGDSDALMRTDGIIVDIGPVALTQERLRRAGFYQGVVDGEFQPLTRRAVVAFQAAHSLAPTGVVDAATSSALIERAQEARDGEATVRAAVAASALPGRAGIDGNALLARGSRIVAGARKLKRRAVTAIVSGSLLLLDKLSGFDGIAWLIAKAEAVQDLAARASGLLGAIASPWVLAGITIVLAGYGLYSLGDDTEQARVDNAREGF